MLPLDTFREKIAQNPWHFWQLGSVEYPHLSPCDPFTRQFAWQNAQAVGRADICEAIKIAEKVLTQYLHYSPGPVLTTELIPVNTRYPDTVKLGLGHVQKIGSYTWQLLGTYAITRSDRDGDGINEYFSFNVATALDIADLACAFSAGDQYTDDIQWVEPVRIDRIDASNIKVSGRSWLLVKPALYHGVGNFPGYEPGIQGQTTTGSIPIENDLNFVTTLALYQKVWTNLNTAQLIVNRSASQTSSDLAALIADSEIGIVRLGGPALCDITNCCEGRPAYQVQISYLSGDDYSVWAETITRLALTELNRYICGCESPEWFRWQHDESNIGSPMSDGGQYRIADRLLKNPLGTKAGQIYAWRRILERRLQEGLSLVTRS